ncbi:hypothetical protein [Salipiger thiooxidans]|uniref:hypothetical protein n=1 Tax=Salipiger thiooxidans TaxID=282683 RepID=UPI001CD3B709|nr:hypothetical protein [Salipiger thiooxidans]MCA0848793.1 hypothetical protein [Salipiger thiooxidans]
MDRVFIGETEFGDNGWGGTVIVSSEFEEDQEKGVIAVEVQIYSETAEDQPRKQQAGLTFGIGDELRVEAMSYSLQDGLPYVACVIAQVGAQVWNDYSDCKKAAKAANPGGSWQQINADALKCLAQKHPSAVSALKTALITCSPAALP